jgi:hypothetical protein
MYAKIFSQIFDSSIATNHHVRHLFMDLLVLADADGVVDMTYDAIARRTNTPVEEVVEYIGELTKPDLASRSSKNNGARLVLIDPGQRDWGWRIVNYRHYRELRNEEARRSYYRGAKKRSYVYYAVAGDRVLIGLSANPWARVTQLRRIYHEIELAAKENGNTDLLRQRQSEFATDSLGCGWFRLGGKLEDRIAALEVTERTVAKSSKKVATSSNGVADGSTGVAKDSSCFPMKTETDGSNGIAEGNNGVAKNGVTEEEEEKNIYENSLSKNSLSVKANESSVKLEISNSIVVQHAAAKRFLAKLSEDVFGRPLYATQWPPDLEHCLDQALPMKRTDFELLYWFYRLPCDHAIFTVTRRKQSMRTLIENLSSEVQKIESALRELASLEQKEKPLCEEDGWTPELVAEGCRRYHTNEHLFTYTFMRAGCPLRHVFAQWLKE